MFHQKLRLLKVDIIRNIGFFVCDLHLHQRIEYLEKGISVIDFEKLKNVQDELISFLHFPSNSERSAYALFLATSAPQFIEMNGILSVTNIDPTIPYTPFADTSKQVDETH